MNAGWKAGFMVVGLLLMPLSSGWAQEPPPAEPPAAGGALGEDDAMVLNFERADIREVIHSLATALGLSYTIDPRIEGQVTIRTTGRIARDDLFPLFNQILRNNGIAAVKVGDVYQVLPVSEAKTRAIVPGGATKLGLRQTDGFVIEIVSLKHVSADEMSNILQPFLTPGGDVLSYPRANTLVITDINSNIARLRELAQTFDTDAFKSLHTRVFKMTHGDPEELANELLGLLAPYGVTATGDGEGGVYLIPLSRLNAIVVITYDPLMFEEIARWLKMLDIPPDEEAGRQTFVYQVENAKAADLSAVLNELFGGGGGSGGGLGVNPGGTPGGIGLFGASGVSGASGGAGRMGGGGGAGRRGGGVGGAGGVGGVGGVGGGAGQAGGVGGVGGVGGGGGRPGGGRLGGRSSGGGGGSSAAVGGVAFGGVPGAGGASGAAGAAHAVSLPGGQGAGGQVGGPPPIFKQEVRIVADDVTNSLIVLATKRDYNLILDVLRRVDVVPRQVVLECMIAEITLNKTFQFGVQWAIANGDIADIAKPENASGRGVDAGGLGNFIGGKRIDAVTGGAFALLTDQRDLRVLLTTLGGRTNVKALAAPHIIAADNREAHILVGTSVPILTSTSSNVLTSGNGSTVNSVQYRDTGKILTVLPQVNSKGLVNMQIRQEVSDVNQEVFGNTNSPSFLTREAETTLVVQDGETVLIGGIIDDKVTHSRSGIPFLMDIPVIGVAFRSQIDRVERTELLIAITPYVIRSRDEAREVTEGFSSRIMGLRSAQKAIKARINRVPTDIPTTLVPMDTAPLRKPLPAPAEP